MPRQLALILCIAFVFYLFQVERRQHRDAPWALWIPLVWMFFASSRFLTHWLKLLGLDLGGSSDADGSPLDRALFLMLIALAVLVLRRRNVDWKGVFFRNKWLWLFFVFGAVSIVWSEFPLVSAKRLIKALGNVAMALVILTDERPYVALATVLRRLAYLTLPLSVVFSKYFPDIGRHIAAAGMMFTGVGTQKNTLGELCLIAGLYAVWSLLYKPAATTTLAGGRVKVEWVILAMVGYLLLLADSATALVCLVVGVSILVAGRLPLLRVPRRAVLLAVTSAAVFALADSAFNLTARVITALGRRPDLTTRVPMWEEILATSEASPVYGAGFEIYDLTQYGSTTLANWQVPNVHNGYLQIYLDLGVIGLVILAGTILSGLMKVANQDGTGKAGAFLRLALILLVVLYNWTEAAYRSVSSMWMLFLLANMNVGIDGTVRDVITFAKRQWPRSFEPTGAPSGAGQAAAYGKRSGGAIVPRFGSPSTTVPRRPTLQRPPTRLRGKA